tara:strand:+ start:904 stop:1329 length:426 start_codon:yes stop_codon:yes gene_type:complete
MIRYLPLFLILNTTQILAVPVVPNFTSGTMSATTRTTQNVTEQIVSYDYSGYQYSLNGTNISIDSESIAPEPTVLTTTIDGQEQTWTGLDITTRGNVTITNPGQAFQFVETYRSPSLSNITTINRTTVLESVTETTSVFSQ